MLPVSPTLFERLVCVPRLLAWLVFGSVMYLVLGLAILAAVWTIVFTLVGGVQVLFALPLLLLALPQIVPILLPKLAATMLFGSGANPRTDPNAMELDESPQMEK